MSETYILAIDQGSPVLRWDTKPSQAQREDVPQPLPPRLTERVPMPPCV